MIKLPLPAKLPAVAGLDCRAVQFFLLRFHSKSDCINVAQRTMQSFFSRPASSESSVSLSASDEEIIQTAEKTIKPPAFKRQKEKE